MNDDKKPTIKQLLLLFLALFALIVVVFPMLKGFFGIGKDDRDRR